MGKHDLPLLGTADWNDPQSLPGPNNAAESVWSAMLLHKALLELTELCKENKRDDDAQTFEALAKETKDNVNKTAWDGDWYIRAYDDAGKPVGNSKRSEGKIYVNAQSWAVISQIAPKERGIRCMDAVKEHLNTEYGIMLLGPAYTRYYPEIGALTSYAPGLKENASIWSHANAWAILAECMPRKRRPSLPVLEATCSSHERQDGGNSWSRAVRVRSNHRWQRPPQLWLGKAIMAYGNCDVDDEGSHQLDSRRKTTVSWIARRPMYTQRLGQVSP